ncbi:MAG: hypothetical protein R3B81_19640 [bacterium]
MAKSLQRFVLDTLRSPLLDEINFQFGNLRVYPQGLRRDVARLVAHRHIEVTSDPTRVYGPGATVDGGCFVVDTPRGQRHPLFVNPRWTFDRGGHPYVRPLSEYERAELCGTIVHEATHALHDYQRLGRIRPTAAEGAAYMAGAIARRLFGPRPAPAVSNPTLNGITYSLHLADRYLAADRHSRYLIPTHDVVELERRVSAGSENRYIFNGI